MAVVANVAINVDGRQAVGELNKVERATDQLNQGFNTLKAAAAALVGALAIKSIADVGRESQQTKLQLQSLTDQYGELGKATAAVDRIQKVLGISAIDAREGYSQLYAALRGTGVSAEQLEVLFVGLTKAARLSGAGAAEAQGALLQLKQAFASGTLSGDELRSVLESMPAFTQAVAKETDRLGLTSNATSADIKRLGSEGKLTSDILFAAARNIALSNTRQLTSSEALSAAYKNLQERIAEAFGPALVKIVENFAAAVGALGRWFKENKESITSVADAIIKFAKTIGPLAAGIWLVVKAYQAWAVVSKAVAATQAFIATLTGPKGIALVAAAGVAAYGAYQTLNGVLKGTEAELKKQNEESKKASNEFKNIANNAGELPNKNKAAAESAKALTEEYSKIAAKTREAAAAIDTQIQSLERGASVTSARYEAEKAINDLRGQELQREYELANTAQQRLDIAVAIFKQQIEAAKIQYKQALENIELEERKNQLQFQAAQLKYEEIKAEGQLQILKSKNAEEEAKKRQQLSEALGVQNRVIDATAKTSQAQQEVAKYQKIAAEAQYASQVQTAKMALEQKLVSKEIGFSKDEAARLADRLAGGVVKANQLAAAMQNVGNQAFNAAKAMKATEDFEIQGYTVTSSSQSRTKTGNVYEAKYLYPDGSTGSAYIKAHYGSGGYVTRPTAAMIGEAGPEYVIPKSKADTFVANWLSGSRGAGVLVGSSNPPNINITTGPVMQQNGTSYVTLADMESAMQTMASAMLGSNRSYSGRRYQGVR